MLFEALPHHSAEGSCAVAVDDPDETNAGDVCMVEESLEAFLGFGRVQAEQHQLGFLTLGTLDFDLRSRGRFRL